MKKWIIKNDYWLSYIFTIIVTGIITFIVVMNFIKFKDACIICLKCLN